MRDEISFGVVIKKNSLEMTRNLSTFDQNLNMCRVWQ